MPKIKPLFTEEDFNLIAKYKDFGEQRLVDGEQVGYFDKVIPFKQEEEATYAVAYFKKSPDKHNVELYIGYLYHSGIAKFLTFLRKNLKSFTHKYVSKALGRIRVEKQCFRHAQWYRKDKSVQASVWYAGPDHKFAYLLVESGATPLNFLKKNPKRCSEFYYKTGALLAELNKAGYYHDDLKFTNLIVVKDALKLIDLYHNFTDKEDYTSSLVKLNDANLERFVKEFIVLGILGSAFQFINVYSISERKGLVQEFIKGYSSVKRNKYKKKFLEILHKELKKSDALKPRKELPVDECAG